MSIPQQLGQYRIEALLSSDRYADAYRAVDSVRRRTVLLRLLRTDEIGDAVAMRRFMQQAQRAADLVHPRLAWVWETGEDEGKHYLIERFVAGLTVEQRLVESGPLAWEEAQTAISQIAQGLDFAHGRGFDLGAVRPRNMILSQELGAVLSGLGLALGLPPKLTIEAREDALYAAPELWQGRPPSPASDEYALACVFAEMLSGQPLFDAPSIEDIQSRHLGELQLPHTWSAGTPWQVELALERALSKQPAERYPNAVELAEAPGKMALRSAGDEQERDRRAALAQARKQAEEQAHHLVEEAARLAALEQARRELEEQLRHPEPLPVLPDTSALAIQPDQEPPPAADADFDRSSSQDASKIRRTTRRRRNQIVWVILAILILALAGLWLSGRLPGVGPLAATATLTPTQLVEASATPRPTSSPSPTASSTPTVTASPSATPTLTLTPTQTPTPTLTFRATQTPRNTPITPSPRPTRDLGAED